MLSVGCVHLMGPLNCISFCVKFPLLMHCILELIGTALASDVTDMEATAVSPRPFEDCAGRGNGDIDSNQSDYIK